MARTSSPAIGCSTDSCSGAQSKCGGRAIKGQFRRTIGENIDDHGRTLSKNERTFVETDARARLLDAHYVRLTAECQAVVKQRNSPEGGQSRNTEGLDRMPPCWTARRRPRLSGEVADGSCQKRWSRQRMPNLISRQVFWWSLGVQRGLWGHNQGTARFPGGPPSAPAAAPRSLSHAFCVGTIDLAFVSPIVRSVSSSVRRRHPIVSANLRRKVPLIARRAGYDCAPLHSAARSRPQASQSVLSLRQARLTTSLPTAPLNSAPSARFTRRVLVPAR